MTANEQGNEDVWVYDTQRGTATHVVFRPGIPKALFSASSIGTGDLANSYDVSADGERFIIGQQTDQGETPKLAAVENWCSEFKDKQP